MQKKEKITKIKINREKIIRNFLKKIENKKER